MLSASTLPFDLVIAIASCAGPTHLIVRVTEEVLMAASARPRVIGFNHVALEVGDIDEALEFYGRLFRFELRGKSDSMAFIDLGDQFIALQKGRRQPADDGRHFGLVVDDKEAARTALKAAGVAPLETLYADFRDGEGLAKSCRIARRDGFVGRIAIHPDQVATINTCFTPSEADLKHARRVVAAFAASPDVGTVGIDGKMYDMPHLVAARRTLASVGEGSSNG